MAWAPFRWRRGLVSALRGWAGSAGAAIAQLRHRRVALGAVRVEICLPAPVLRTASIDAVQQELLASDRRFVSGGAIVELAELARRGGTILARLEDGGDPSRVAVVSVSADAPETRAWMANSSRRRAAADGSVRRASAPTERTRRPPARAAAYETVAGRLVSPGGPSRGTSAGRAAMRDREPRLRRV
jgi:hypothetical protein